MDHILRFLRNFVDVPVETIFGDFHLWSSFYEPGDTISSTLGMEQLVLGYKEYLKTHNIDLPEPEIPLEHPLGDLFIDVCDFFQSYHGYLSIEPHQVAKLEKKYPGISDFFDQYLKQKGIK